MSGSDLSVSNASLAKLKGECTIMIPRFTLVALSAGALLFATKVASGQQQLTTPANTVTSVKNQSLPAESVVVPESYGPTRTVYENGVVYNEQGDSVFYAVAPCKTDNYGFQINWGDSNT